jgi:hypothetical protein
MKILAKVLLSSGFVFLPAVGAAQDDYFVPQKDCGSLHTLGNTTIVEELADKQDCINGNQIQLKTSVENLRFRMRSNEIDILVLGDKLKQTQLETKIETLEASLHLIERRLAMAEDEIEWLTPKAPARKPKVPDRKPTPDFIPDTPATTPHPASKKSDASNPITLGNKTSGKPTAGGLILLQIQGKDHTLPNSSTNPATGPSPSTTLPPSTTSTSRPAR